MRQNHRRFRSVAAGLALLLAAAGCGRNSGTVPADFSPSGQPQDNQMTVELFNTSIDSGVVIPAVRLRVYDRTRANGYTLYRRLPGEGFDRLDRDAFRFDGSFDQNFEAYEAVDREWVADRPVDYQARGEVAGVEMPVSPLTNVATLPGAPDPVALFADTFEIVCPISTQTIIARTDSTPVLVWEAVPGAVRYLLRVMRLDHRLFFYGFTPPDGSHSYQLGTGLGEVMHENTLSLKSLFDWSVQAIDAQSRVVGISRPQRFETRTIAEADSLTFCTP